VQTAGACGGKRGPLQVICCLVLGRPLGQALDPRPSNLVDRFWTWQTKRKMLLPFTAISLVVLLPLLAACLPLWLEILERQRIQHN